ncbi:probable cytochrome P450 6g2 [Glossina fuscipes]|uniref:Probable cytochrome P450 6g2 n=2 Tax=Glossina fuscipes TaxID=7396 RepID=A0A9C6DV89_9MUSC|nr:probable cytochrome P450 6g2 [Glossina fuscipes]
MWFAITVGLVLQLLVLLYVYLTYRYRYWLRHGVLDVKPNPILGNLGCLLRMQCTSAHMIQAIYNYPEAGDRPFVGIYLFHRPALLLRDPELIKRILSRDFPKFSNRFSNSDYFGDPLASRNLFFLKNPYWKEIRLKLTPFFTSGKLKQMCSLIEEVGLNLNEYLLKMPLNGDKIFQLELKELCSLYTTDVIATVAFGIQANSFKYPNGEFRHNGREIFRFSTRRALNLGVVFFLPYLVPYLRTKVVPTKQTEFLRSTMNRILEEREKSGMKRHDLIDILIEFKNQTKNQPRQDDLKFEGDLLVAQAAIFFIAGFESTSTTMSFTLYELAKNPEMQERLRKEVCDALNESRGKITQQIIESLEYMQMIIDETLRLYPPLPFLDRECSLPKGQSYSLEPFHSFSIPAGMPVYTPVYALHMDPKYFPQPHEFQPERFSPERKKLITPYTYMPFGLGPHACIGERFAMLQTKIGLLNFLRNHRVAMGEKSVNSIILDPKALILQSQGGIHLNVIRDPLKY